jgi:hypothetical protein
MAKKRVSSAKGWLLDRTLTVGIILLAVAYITHGTWAGAFVEAMAFAVAVMWSYRAILTNPRREFRLLALLVLVLSTMLLAFFLAASQGLA